MKRRYPMVVEQGEDMLAGSFPDLPGCFTAGRTMAELLENAKEAVALYLEDCVERGEALPDATNAIALEMVELEDPDQGADTVNTAHG